MPDRCETLADLHRENCNLHRLRKVEDIAKPVEKAEAELRRWGPYKKQGVKAMMNPFPMTTGAIELIDECIDTAFKDGLWFNLIVAVGLSLSILGPCLAVDIALVMPAIILLGWLGIEREDAN